MSRKLFYFYPTGHQAHNLPGHQECPERLEAVVDGLRELGWWDESPRLMADPVPLEVLHSVHRPEYLEKLQHACQQREYLDLTTYTTPDSWRLAQQAAGGAIALARAVWLGNAPAMNELTSGLALTRPPGHHAGITSGMGFCLLNNIALAAEYLRQKQAVNRITIVDLDLHHGNGTQEIFWRRPDVAYISTHQAPLFPGTGLLEEVGAGAGQGCTANFPLPPGTGDQGYLAFMQGLILPLLDRFQPEIILVSAGFDPHWRDPFGHLQLSAAGYGKLVTCLVKWADKYCHGRIAFFMEGGYDLSANAACAQALVAALKQAAWIDPLGPTPLFEGSSWKIVLQRALKIWNP